MMNRTVAFTAMEHGTQDDYELIDRFGKANAAQQADRVPVWLTV